MAKNIIKKNVEVKVIAGSHKGSIGKVLNITKDRQRVTVDKVNIVKKHNKPTQQNPDGGITEFEAPIHISNVKIHIKEKQEKKNQKAEAKEDAKVAKTEAKTNSKVETPKVEVKTAAAPKAPAKTEEKVETKKDEK